MKHQKTLPGTSFIVVSAALAGMGCPPPALAATTDIVAQVSNVTEQVCTGTSQSTCTAFSVPGFTESLSFDGVALSSDDIGTGGGVYASEATYSFPFSSKGNPYTAGLLGILAQAATSTIAYTDLNASFASGSGAAFGQIYADLAYDDGDGGTGEFSQNYAVSHELTGFGAYRDLTATSAHDFLSTLGSFAGSYTAFATSQVFDAGQLVSGSYAFTQYTGDLTLTAAVPEPYSLPLMGAGLLAIALRLRLRRKSRPAAI